MLSEISATAARRRRRSRLRTTAPPTLVEIAYATRTSLLPVSTYATFSGPTLPRCRLRANSENVLRVMEFVVIESTYLGSGHLPGPPAAFGASIGSANYLPIVASPTRPPLPYHSRLPPARPADL